MNRLQLSWLINVNKVSKCTKTVSEKENFETQQRNVETEIIENSFYSGKAILDCISTGVTVYLAEMTASCFHDVFFIYYFQQSTFSSSILVHCM